MMYRAIVAVTLFLSLNLPGEAATDRDAVPTLFRYTAGNIAGAFNGPQVVNAQRVALDPDVLLRRPGSLRFSLPGGNEIIARLTEFHRRTIGDGTWIGRIEGKPDSRILLTARNGSVVGSIVGLDYTYLLEPLADGGLALKTVQSSLYPECGGGVELNSVGLQAPDVVAGDAGDRIDVMVLYTPQARDAAGGVAGIEATAQSAVDIANLAFADSNVTPRFSMVFTGLAAHNDTGSSSADLSWLRSDAEVADLRNQYGADLVGLLANDGGGFCGIAYVMRNVDPSFESSAFQVTARGCAVGNLTYAHEHGHNMGMEHDPANGTEPENASYASSFGHYVDGSYRTVMSYSNQCTSGCTRVAHFSNPNVTQNGVATGIEDERENYQTANLVASTVANFRPQVCSGILDIALTSQTVSTIEVFDACRNITGGDGFAVENDGDVTLIAGGYVALDTGFSVAVGGLLTVTIR